MDKQLYLFTASFPYGWQEPFLEKEILFLSKKFKKIYIIPLGGYGAETRPIPSNCIVDNRLQSSRSHKVFFAILGAWRVLPMCINDLLENKVLFNKSKLRLWGEAFLVVSFYMQSKLVKELYEIKANKDVFYFYWGTGANAISHYFKNKVKLISRFHGDGDLWKDQKTDGYIPLRKYLTNSLSAAILISNKGETYFRKLYPKCKTLVFPLGSTDNGISSKSTDGVIRIVSCSNVYPLKRVDLIFESLKKIEQVKIEWTHIGGGPSFDDLRNLVDTHKEDRLKIYLLGQKKNTEVMQYYKENFVDIFINMSINEGLPVSIMEAISFNIPVIATNVGATCEIVNQYTGVLLSANPSVEEVSDAVHYVVSRDFHPRRFWLQNYNSESNYSKFADFLESEY